MMWVLSQWATPQLYGRQTKKTRTPFSRGPRLVLRLRAVGAVLGEHLASLSRDLRGDNPRRVLGLSDAGVLLAEPIAQHLRVDAELGSELLRGVGLRLGCHCVTSFARVVFNVHDAIVSHMAASSNAVRSNLQKVYKRGATGSSGGFSASGPRHTLCGFSARGPRRQAKKREGALAPPLEGSSKEVADGTEDQDPQDQRAEVVDCLDHLAHPLPLHHFLEQVDDLVEGSDLFLGQSRFPELEVVVCGDGRGEQDVVGDVDAGECSFEHGFLSVDRGRASCD